MKRIAVLLLLILVGATAAYSQQTAVVIAVNANLRGTPSSEGKVVVVLPTDTKLEVIKQKEAWFLVQAPEYVGWMHGDTIRITTAISMGPLLYFRPRTRFEVRCESRHG